MAAEQGDAGAQTMLSAMYFFGMGVPEDAAEALKWIRMAAEQGHANAQFNLGWMYANGKGVPLDYVKAENWFGKAADQGHVEAQKNQDKLAFKLYTQVHFPHLSAVDKERNANA
jgi:TPR repeat protein